jgi:hypothetical protein
MSDLAKTWSERAADLIKSAGANLEYAEANAEAIRGAVTGFGPDDPKPDKNFGAKMVCNMSSAHVPAFVDASISGEEKPYKNAYDLSRYRIGGEPGKPLKMRELVDAALPLEGFDASDVYFGAVELNGTGMRFYGDICLVLKAEAVPKETVVLDRNSFDLARSPLREIIEKEQDQKAARKKAAKKLSGTWKADLPSMSCIKVLEYAGPLNRRITTAGISDGLLHDEDYIEVLLHRSFGIDKIQEARASAADAALEAHISQRSQQSPIPTAESLLWRARRRQAEAALLRGNCLLRVVVTTGRTR